MAAGHRLQGPKEGKASSPTFPLQGKEEARQVTGEGVSSYQRENSSLRNLPALTLILQKTGVH